MSNKIKRYAKNTWVFLSKNYFVLILSLICAMILWGFVLANQNPQRTKSLNSIKLSFEGEADLLARNLTVVGDRSTILPEITVVASTDLLHYSDLTAANITATVSLRNVTGEGLETLSIRATTTNGTIVRIHPSTIMLEVDKLVSKTIPIMIEYENDVAQDYWRSEPLLSKQEVDITGAYSILSSISEAVCVLSLNNKTSSFTESVNLSLRDDSGFSVSPGLLSGRMPTVSVSIDILNKKTVPLDLKGALIGENDLPTDYKIYELITEPATVTIIGSAKELSTIDMLSLEKFDITGKKSNQQKSLTIIVPKGIKISDGITSVTAHVNIREKTITRDYSNVPLKAINLSNGLVSRFVYAYADISLVGPISKLKAITRQDIKLYVDLMGLGTGVYDMPIEVKFDNADSITFRLKLNTCSVIISKAQ